MLTIRPLRPWDALFCWCLANEPSVREASEDRTPPTVWGHVRWMLRWLFSRDRQAWVVRGSVVTAIREDGWGGEPCIEWRSMGLVRVERRARPLGGRDIGVLSIAVLPEYRGRGVARVAISYATGWARGRGMEPRAYVRRDNKASRAAFEAASWFVGDANYRRDWIVMATL